MAGRTKTSVLRLAGVSLSRPRKTAWPKSCPTYISVAKKNVTGKKIFGNNNLVCSITYFWPDEQVVEIVKHARRNYNVTVLGVGVVPSPTFPVFTVLKA